SSSFSASPGMKGVDAMMASWPRRTGMMPSGSVKSPCALTSPAAEAIFSGWRAMPVTWWPRLSNSATILLPILPLAPMTATFLCMGCSSFRYFVYVSGPGGASVLEQAGQGVDYGFGPAFVALSGRMQGITHDLDGYVAVFVQEYVPDIQVM